MGGTLFEEGVLAAVLAATRSAGLETVLIALSSGARFESVRSRASDVRVAQVRVRVASLDDVIAAKRAAGRPKDLAVLPVLESAARVAAELRRAGLRKLRPAKPR